MQTPVYIPATHARNTPILRPDRSVETWEFMQHPCTILAFVGISGLESNHLRAGAFTAVHAIAMWDNGELFESPVARFTVTPEVDLTPPEIEIGEDAEARVAQAQAAVDAGKRRRRER